MPTSNLPVPGKNSEVTRSSGHQHVRSQVPGYATGAIDNTVRVRTIPLIYAGANPYISARCSRCSRKKRPRISAKVRNFTLINKVSQLVYTTSIQSPSVVLDSATYSAENGALVPSECFQLDVLKLRHTSRDERAQALCANFVLQATNAQGLGTRLALVPSECFQLGQQ